MKFLREITWHDIFEGWREREASNPGWIKVATKIKGWPDWESWRSFTAQQLDAEHRSWRLEEFADPLVEVPAMFVGPYGAWQERVSQKNRGSFEELINEPGAEKYFRNHAGVQSIFKALPFPTQMIGLVRKDVDKIVCLEGHHRATAIALAKKDGAPIDFTGVSITIALTKLSPREEVILDEMLSRGTSKNPKA